MAIFNVKAASLCIHIIGLSIEIVRFKKKKHLKHYINSFQCNDRGKV